MKRRLQQVLQILVHVDDTPHRIALAFAIGVFIAFSPLIGVHTGLALLIAYLFRLSRGPMLVGAYVNNPWTLAPLYMAGTLLGCFLLGVSADGIEEIDWSLHGAAFYRTLFEGLRPYVWPFIIGNTVLGIVCGAASYFALRFVLERRRQRAASASS